MSKTFFFFHGLVPPSSDGHKYITTGPDYRVDGGTKEEHAQMAELTGEVSRRVKAGAPRRISEFQQIVRESAEKTGMIPRR